jgi:hypothetical protein
LLQALGYNKHLTDLDLRDNHIGTRGATILAQALQTNVALVYIPLLFLLTHPIVQSFTCKNYCQVSLAYDGNQTTPSGFRALDYAMKRNGTLRRWPTPSKDVSCRRTN